MECKCRGKQNRQTTGVLDLLGSRVTKGPHHRYTHYQRSIDELSPIFIFQCYAASPFFLFNIFLWGFLCRQQPLHACTWWSALLRDVPLASRWQNHCLCIHGQLLSFSFHRDGCWFQPHGQLPALHYRGSWSELIPAWKSSVSPG